jgi:hypothetical protein
VVILFGDLRSLTSSRIFFVCDDFSHMQGSEDWRVNKRRKRDRTMRNSMSRSRESWGWREILPSEEDLNLFPFLFLSLIPFVEGS